MYARQEYQRPATLQIDLNQATFQAFLNCINSFQGLETESKMGSESGVAISSMTSKVSMERFVYNLGILDGLVGEKQLQKEVQWKGGEYDPMMTAADAFKYWAALKKWLEDVGFFKHPRRISHL